MTSSYDTIRSETCTKEPSILILHWHYLHMIKLTHVLGHRGSEFPNIINTDCRTIQIVLFMLHLRRGTDFTHNWPRMTPGLISHVHNSFEVYLWQTRHTSGHFNMNAGVKGDDGEQGKTGNAVSCRVPPRRVNVGCLWSLSCVWNELLVPATITHTHTHTLYGSLRVKHYVTHLNTAVHEQIYTFLYSHTQAIIWVNLTENFNANNIMKHIFI